MNNEKIKLRAELADHINIWLGQISEKGTSDCMGTSISDNLHQLMADAAFSVFHAQSDLTEYYVKENLLYNV